jgi:hypothetical protein
VRRPSASRPIADKAHPRTRSSSASAPDAGDIVGCSAVATGYGTATVTLQMGAPVAIDGGIQYRLELSDDLNSSGSQVKWSGGKSTGKALKSAGFLDFAPDTGYFSLAI